MSCYHCCTLHLTHQNCCSEAALGSGGSADCQSSVWLKGCMAPEAAEASAVMRQPGQEPFFPFLFLTLGCGVLYSPNPDCAFLERP